MAISAGIDTAPQLWLGFYMADNKKEPETKQDVCQGCGACSTSISSEEYNAAVRHAIALLNARYVLKDLAETQAH